MLPHIIYVEDLTIIQGRKEEQYQAKLPQIKALIEGETDLVAANIAGALKGQFGWFWVDFYLVKGKQLLVGRFRDLWSASGSTKAAAYAVPAGPKQKH